MAYITYIEYKDLGGTAEEATFNNLIQIVEAKLDYMTNGRIQELDSIPDEVKSLCVRLIDICTKMDIDTSGSLTSYSNGIESFGYATQQSKGYNSTAIDSKLTATIQEWLWKYPELLYRGRKQWKQKL